jgi:hypothetical protein
MKRATLILFIFYLSPIFSQEINSDLFQTWYLDFVMASDGRNEPLRTSDYNVESAPYITINEDLSFTGLGVCNSFFGKFKRNENDNSLYVNEFSSTEISCEEILMPLEEELFAFMRIAIYPRIKSENNSLALFLFTGVFGEGKFINSVLNAKSEELKKITINFENNFTSLKVNSNNLKIKKVEVFNVIGKKLLSENRNFKIIKLENFSVGIFIVRIHTDSGVIHKKILKRY